MSLPNIPNINPAITLTREEVLNLIIASVALEEIGLSHIINAEGEKIQFVIGTIPGLNGPRATIQDIIAIDNSVKQVLDTILKKEVFLISKLENALNT